jgi:hypothetical protein
VTSGQINEEKCYATNAFQWEKMFLLAIKDSDLVFLSYHFFTEVTSFTIVITFTDFLEAFLNKFF